jgi:serine/threonine protein kinase
MTVPALVPPVSDSADDRLVVLVEELTARLQSGEPVDVEAFLAEHGEHAGRLRTLLPTLHVLAEFGQSPLAEPGEQAPGSDEPVRRVLGDFRIMREVGRGGMGIVYEAEQVSLGRRVAVKVLPFAATLDVKQLMRFQNEARAAAYLHHQHIVPVYYVGCERGIHFYAMQFIDGRSLAAVVAELHRLRGHGEPKLPSPVTETADASHGRPVPPAETAVPPFSQPETDHLAGLVTERLPCHGLSFQTVARLGIQAAEALEYAHQLGIIHRDIKPANLMVDQRGNLWITDFGLAHCQSQAGLTMTGDLMGTLRYMSPEQVQGKRGLLDHRTDIYSLGVTLYELLTLEPTFPGDDRNDVLRRIPQEEPRPPRRLRPGIPAELQTIVLKAIEKEPANRYLTAQDLADDLERFLEDKPIRAKRPTWIQQVRKWQRRHRTIVVICGLAALLILVVSAGLLAVNTVQIRAEQKRTKGERDRAQAALAAEEKQRKFAEENLRLALQALDEVFITPAEAEVRIAGWERRALMPEHLERLDRTFLQKGLEFYERFAQTNHTNPALQEVIGKAHERAGRVHMIVGKKDKAETAFRRAIAILEKVDEGPPAGPESRMDLAEAYHWLGQLLKDVGRLEEAEGILRQNLAVSQKLAAAFPGVANYRLHLCLAGIAFGDLVRARGRPQEARQWFEQALDVARKTLADFPALGDGPGYEIRQWLGDLLKQLGSHSEAETLYRQNLNLALRLVADSPTVADHWQKLAHSQWSLARLYVPGRIAEAEQVYRQVISLAEQLVSRFPDVAAYQDGPARSYIGLGDVLWVRGQYAAAVEQYQRALTVKPDFGDGHWKLAWFLVNCAEVRFRDPARAIEAAKKALAATMENGHYWKTLGWASYRAGKWEAAIEALERANWYCAGGGSYEWFPLAMAHWQRGDKELARQWYVKACRWMQDHEDKFSKEPGYFWDEEFNRFRAEAAEVLGIRDGETKDIVK